MKSSMGCCLPDEPEDDDCDYLGLPVVCLYALNTDCAMGIENFLKMPSMNLQMLMFLSQLYQQQSINCKDKMEKKIYELMIFQQDNLIYYNDFQSKPRDYQQLKQNHRIQNCLGLSMSICALIKQIHPDHTTQFRNFKTKQYQYNLHETVNGVKIILITSVLSKPQDQQIENHLKKVHHNYIDLVKRNYLYKHGDVIYNDKFDHAITNALLKKH